MPNKEYTEDYMDWVCWKESKYTKELLNEVDTAIDLAYEELHKTIPKADWALVSGLDQAIKMLDRLQQFQFRKEQEIKQLNKSKGKL